MKNITLICFLSSVLMACSGSNGEAKYDKVGYPSNCRAYVQAAIDNYRKNTDYFKGKVIDTPYYCEPDDWHSQKCHNHLAKMSFYESKKNEQIKLLIDSVESHCGKYGNMW